MPSFLLEYGGGNPGIKNRIQININQVIKIPQVLTGYRVAGLVRIGKRVKERMQRSFQQFHETVLSRDICASRKERNVPVYGPRPLNRKEGFEK